MAYIYKRSGDDPQALANLNAINGSDLESLADAIAVTDGAREEIIQSIADKGVEVSSDAGLVTLADKVEQIESGDDWAHLFFERFVNESKNLQWTFPDYVTGDIVDEYEDTATSIGSYMFRYSSFATFNSTKITKVSIQAFSGNTTLTECIIPNATEFGSQNFRGCTSLRKLVTNATGQLPDYLFYGAPNLEWLEFGLFTYKNNTFTQTGYRHLRMFKVGEGFDDTITICAGATGGWSATDVIAEGETSQLELIANARSGLLERVQDHTGEGLVRTITAAWVGTIAESEYDTVLDALDELQLDFANKGWILEG